MMECIYVFMCVCYRSIDKPRYHGGIYSRLTQQSLSNHITGSLTAQVARCIHHFSQVTFHSYKYELGKLTLWISLFPLRCCQRGVWPLSDPSCPTAAVLQCPKGSWTFISLIWGAQCCQSSEEERVSKLHKPLYIVPTIQQGNTSIPHYRWWPSNNDPFW